MLVTFSTRPFWQDGCEDIAAGEGLVDEEGDDTGDEAGGSTMVFA